MRRACVGPLKKSGSPNVMCSRPRGYLGANVAEHHVGLHHAELPVVHRHDRTVPAPVLAAARCLCVARHASFAGGEPQRRVPAQRRQAGPVGRDERQSGQRKRRRRHVLTGDERHEVGFRLGTEHHVHAERAQVLLVRWCIETVCDQPRRRIVAPHALDHGHREPRGGVHRQVDGHQVGVRCRDAVEWITDRSMQRTSAPARRSQAAADASPNGWRPSS